MLSTAFNDGCEHNVVLSTAIDEGNELENSNPNLRVSQHNCIVAYFGPSGCVRCHGNKVSTINGVIFSLSLLSAGLLFSQKGLS